MPLSVLRAVIATSRYYSIEKVMPLLPPLMILSLGLVPAKKSCVDAPATTQTLRGLDALSGPPAR